MEAKTKEYKMSEKTQDNRKWLSIFPDYPYAFAWLRAACSEEELTSAVGGWYGDADPSENRADIGDFMVEPELAEKNCRWMEHWRLVEDKINGADEEEYENVLATDGRAVDLEGIEIARLIKARYSDTYRVRYSYAWEHGGIDWVVV